MSSKSTSSSTTFDADPDPSVVASMEREEVQVVTGPDASISDGRREIVVGPDMSDEDERTVLDMFLSVDPPVPDTEEVEIMSLTRKYGKPFIIRVRELTDSEMSDIFEMFGILDTAGGNRASRRQRGEAGRRKQSEMSAHIVAAALVEPDLTRAGKPIYQLLKEKIKPLELAAVAEIVMDLSGGADDAVQVVKN